MIALKLLTSRKPVTDFDQTTVVTRHYEKSEKHGRQSTGLSKGTYVLASIMHLDAPLKNATF